MRDRDRWDRDSTNNDFNSNRGDYFDRQGMSSRNQSSYRNNYGTGSYNRDRDWSDRAGDEVRSWFGDDDAERRRRMDERRDNYSDRDNNRYQNNWGSSDRDRYDNSRNIGSDRYSDRSTGYGSGYGNNQYSSNRYNSGNRFDRDWADRAGDEVSSWFGDDDAERRRRMDDRRDYNDRDNTWGRNNYRNGNYNSNRRDNDSWW